MAEQERLDGVLVEVRSGVFAGGFDFNWADIEALGYDRTMVIVAVVRNEAPAFRPTPQGTLRRVDKLAVQEVRIAVGDRGIELAEVFDMDYQGSLALNDPLADAEPAFQTTRGASREIPQPEPEPESESESEPEAPMTEAEAEAAPVSRADKAKAAAKRAERSISTPPSALVGQHVGGGMAHDERLARLLDEPVSGLVHGGRD